MVKKAVKKTIDKKTVDKKTDINFPLVAYILGIVSIVQAFISPISGIAFAIIGLVFAKNQKDSVSKTAYKLNLIGLIIGIVFFALVIFASFGNVMPIY
jgi:uncharacterized membrane protein